MVSIERPFTAEEVAAWQRLATPPPPVPAWGLKVKGAVWAMIAVCGLLAISLEPTRPGIPAGPAILFMVIGVINAWASFAQIPHANSPTVAARRERNQAILDDGYAIEETFAPRRVVTVEWESDFYLYELDDTRVLYCPPYIDCDGLFENELGADAPWPNTYFTVSYSRLDRVLMSVTLHGDAMEPDRLVDSTDTAVVDADKFDAFLERDDIEPGDFCILNGTLDDLLASFLQRASG
jgi:hypothetical protein